jgi:RHS repeat-associated protein
MIRIAEPLPDDDGPYESRDEHRRWYDPTVGRWRSEDVVGFAACNVPCYVGNSPLAASDPSQI